MDKQIHDYPVDIVLPWVDGSDPVWRKKMAKYRGDNSEGGESEERFRDFGLLRFVFRGIAEFAPWVRKVFFITDGQKPDWLNTEYEKLVWIKHEDYIPSDYLPTFSANPIELNLHRINELSEHFLYFNDDFYLLRRVEVSHFFRNGLPVESPLTAVVAPKTYDGFAHIALNNTMLINSSFSARKVMKQAPDKWLSLRKCGAKTAARNFFSYCLGRFPGFTNPHLPSPFLKESFRQVWEKYEPYLINTCSNRFRSYSDVSQYLVYEWQLATGCFEPEKSKKIGKYFCCRMDDPGLLQTIRRQEEPVICINDAGEKLSPEEWSALKQIIQDAFMSILPEKSQFEL
ncbi:MAG: stealth family protein [Lachnospiraceae bacterium]|nr:stealth family protein [Lachnospiraceae bacterium]